VQIAEVQIEKVRPYPGNPRKNAEAVAKVASSLATFGWRQPIVVDEEFVVIAGHTRLLAAQQLGHSTVPVHVATGLTPEQVRAYRLADNRVAQEAEWNDDLLAQELLALANSGFDLAMTGFDDDELARLLTPPIENDEGAEVEVPTTPVTKIGDVIVMGQNRLVCGNTLDPQSIQKATSGNAIAAVMFDPPFEASDIIAAIDLNVYNAADLFVFGDCMHDTSRRARTSLPWRFQFVWDGVTRWVIPGRPLIAHKTCDWFSSHGKYDHDAVKDSRDIRDKPTKGKNARGEYEIAPDPRGQSLASVFRSPITAESHGAEHSKPVLWLSMIFGNCSAGPLLDLFAGSGASLIACERIGRPWCGIELNPAYCDVIVARWEQATGLKAVYEQATGSEAA
jgi:hypothetical protein